MAKTTQPIRDKNQARALINHYLQRGQIRNYALIIIGIYTALRISDMLCLNWKQVYDFKRKRLRKTITLQEKKTGKIKTVALNKNCKKALKRLLHTAPPSCPAQAVFQNKHTGKAISRIQAYRIIRDASEAVNLEEHVSCHSLRKTFANVS
jgi:integrase